MTTTATAAVKRAILAPVLQRRERGRRDGAGLGEPFAVSGAGSLTGAGGATLRGCNVIGPYSSEVKRHQLKVAVQLEARIQVIDPDRQDLVLGRQQISLCHQ